MNTCTCVPGVRCSWTICVVICILYCLWAMTIDLIHYPWQDSTLLSDLLTDTTSQHGSHVFDYNCGICLGKKTSLSGNTSSKPTSDNRLLRGNVVLTISCTFTWLNVYLVYENFLTYMYMYAVHTCTYILHVHVTVNMYMYFNYIYIDSSMVY